MAAADERRRGLSLQRFDKRTVPDLLDRSQALGLDRPIIVAKGSALSYGEFLTRVAGLASILARRFAPGSRIACLLENGEFYLITRYALSCSNLVEVAINGHHKGAVLRHMLGSSRPRAVIVADRFMNNLRSCGFALSGVTLIFERELLEMASARLPWNGRPTPTAGPTETCRILFTSGTSGMSKAVELSHAYEVYTGQRHLDLIDIGDSDRWLYMTPMFHIDAIYIFSILLHVGGALALSESFSASHFWEEVDRTRATYLCYVGSILPILLKTSPERRSSSLRFAVGGGATQDQIDAFERRFGITVLEAFAMTECIACLFSTATARCAGSVGRPIDGYEVAILDRNGGPLPADQIGEIAVRSREPCGIFSGYFGDSVATAEAMRGGWFHTGDLGCRGTDGYFFYRGRMKDAIRVGGENVSAAELEAIAQTHPAVAAAAAISVPADLGEDDILICVERKEGAEIGASALLDYLRERVVPFMLPRYIRILDRLPRTATEKVQKSALSRTIDENTFRRQGR
jgi:crotonobetaine/carnitine-CoA ligase